MDGRPVIERIRAALAPLPTALNANGDPARFADLGLPVLAGQPPRPSRSAGRHPRRPRLGRSTGRGLAADRARPTLPSSRPTSPPALHQARGTGDYACAASDGRNHPIVALWPTHCRAALRQALHGGLRKVAAFAPQPVATWPTDPVDPFTNLNTPADLDPR